MTPAEILSEIKKMTLDEAREVGRQLLSYLHEQKEAALIIEKKEEREDESERYLLACDETDEEFDTFEPIAVEGESLSETIIRERR